MPEIDCLIYSLFMLKVRLKTNQSTNLHRLPVEVLSAVVTASTVYQKLEHGDGLLRAVRVHSGHVHIVDEYHQPSAQRRSVDVLRTLLHVRLQVALNVQRIGPAGKVDLQQLELFRIEGAEKVDGRRRFASSALANQ